MTRRLVTTAVVLALSSSSLSSSAAVAPRAPRLMRAPTISGTAQSGSTLKASPGLWMSASSYAFLWRSCDTSGGACRSLSGSTGQTYTLTAGDVGTTLRVQVSARNSAGSTSATSAPSALVTPVLAPTPAPVPPVATTPTPTVTTTTSTPPPSTTTSATPPPSAATTPTVPVPAPAPDVSGRWFGNDSPLNTPIAADAAVDPNSPAMVQGIAAATRPGGVTIASKHWSVPVYYADASTLHQDVTLTADWRIANTLYNVPVPAGAQPDPEPDGHLAIIDRSTGCFYEFLGAVHNANGTLQADWANRGLLTDSGLQPGGQSTRGSGFANLAGLIRPEELQAGVINHALVFSYPYVKAGGPVLPATKSDGRAQTEGAAPAGSLAIPEGTRVQLDPALDLNSLGLTPWQKTIARALQVYGMYLGDVGGGTTLYAVNPQGYSSNPYTPFWGDTDYSYLPASIVGKLRVLQSGPQYSWHGSIADSPCGALR